MKTMPSHPSHWITAAVGVAAILVPVSSEAAFANVPDNTGEFPGIALTGTTGLTGTMVASQEQSWSLPLIQGTFSGTLRSMVVDNGGVYDFYYQVVNTSTGGVSNGMDIFRLAVPGFPLTDPLNPVDATYRTDGLAGITGLDALATSWLGTQISNNAGGGQVFSADRDPLLDTPDFFGGGAAFDFDASQFINTNVGGATTAPDNIEAGERSNWLVLRTNVSYFNAVQSGVLSSQATGLASTFAPIPEPSTVLFGLAVLGVCGSGRRRKACVA